MSKIKVIVLEPDKIARIEEIEDTLESLQSAVGGGYIEPVYAFEDDVCLVCNEEGKFNGMWPNRALKYNGRVFDVVMGPCFICGLIEDNFGSVPEDLMDKYFKMFEYPEMILSLDGKIEAIKYDPVYDPIEDEEALG